MRALVSLLASSLVMATLVFDCQVMVNRLSNLLLASSNSQQLLAIRPKPRPNQPERPTPHRGSGRRELMEYNRNVRPAV